MADDNNSPSNNPLDPIKIDASEFREALKNAGNDLKKIKTAQFVQNENIKQVGENIADNSQELEKDATEHKENIRHVRADLREILDQLKDDNTDTVKNDMTKLETIVKDFISNFNRWTEVVDKMINNTDQLLKMIDNVKFGLFRMTDALSDATTTVSTFATKLTGVVPSTPSIPSSSSSAPTTASIAPSPSATIAAGPSMSVDELTIISKILTDLVGISQDQLKKLDKLNENIEHNFQIGVGPAIPVPGTPSDELNDLKESIDELVKLQKDEMAADQAEIQKRNAQRRGLGLAAFMSGGGGGATSAWATGEGLMGGLHNVDNALMNPSTIVAYLVGRFSGPILGIIGGLFGAIFAPAALAYVIRDAFDANGILAHIGKSIGEKLKEVVDNTNWDDFFEGTWEFIKKVNNAGGYSEKEQTDKLIEWFLKTPGLGFAPGLHIFTPEEKEQLIKEKNAQGHIVPNEIPAPPLDIIKKPDIIQPSQVPDVPAVPAVVQPPVIPAASLEKPATAQPVPASALEKPIAAQPVPASAIEKPATAQPVPASALEKPATAQPVPASALEKPIQSPAVPASALEKPIQSPAVPASALEKPATAIKSAPEQTKYTSEIIKKYEQTIAFLKPSPSIALVVDNQIYDLGKPLGQSIALQKPILTAKAQTLASLKTDVPSIPAKSNIIVGGDKNTTMVSSNNSNIYGGPIRPTDPSVIQMMRA